MPRAVVECDWAATPKEAVVIQRELAAHVRLDDDWRSPPRLVAGVDVGLHGGAARAAIAVFSFPEMELVDSCVAEKPARFPYVPGLLTWREAPAILAAMESLCHEPDVYLYDGQGYAHPRRMGLATHLGILTDTATVGCAKSRLCGEHPGLARERGTWVPLTDRDERIGAVVRTRSGVRPLYVSVGNRVSLQSAIDLVLACGRGVRLPEPTRWAHRLASGDRR